MPTVTQRRNSMNVPDRYGVGGRVGLPPMPVAGTEVTGLGRAAKRARTRAAKHKAAVEMARLRRG